MSRTITIALILILATSSLIMFQPTIATFAPTAPKFTLRIINHTYDEPTTYTTNQYTGEKIASGGTHYEWQTLDITITNQPVDQDDESNHLVYNIRHKGQYTDQWTERSGEGAYYPQNASAPDTVVSYYIKGNYPGYPGAVCQLGDVPDGAQVQFQVQAICGYDDYNFDFGMRSYMFSGTGSVWSSTQTITIGNGEVTISPSPASPSPSPIQPTPTASPTAEPTQNPTQTIVQPNTQTGVLSGIAWKDIPLAVACIVIVALAIALVLSRKRKT
jgi:hypothetical protein